MNSSGSTALYYKNEIHKGKTPPCAKISEKTNMLFLRLLLFSWVRFSAVVGVCRVHRIGNI